MAIKAARNHPAHRWRQLVQNLTRCGFVAELRKYARAGAAHSRGTELPQPCEMSRDVWIMPANHGFEVVPAC